MVVLPTRMVEGLIPMRETMIKIMTETIDMVIGMAGEGGEAMEAGVAAKSGTVEDTLGKGLGEVVIIVVVERTEEVMAVVAMVAVEDTVEVMGAGRSIGGIISLVI